MQEPEGNTERQTKAAEAETPVKEWHKPVLTVMPIGSAEFGVLAGGDVSGSS
jgi:hypothetical protein